MDTLLVIISYEIVRVIRDKELFSEEIKSCFDEHLDNYNYFITLLLGCSSYKEYASLKPLLVKIL